MAARKKNEEKAEKNEQAKEDERAEKNEQAKKTKKAGTDGQVKRARRTKTAEKTEEERDLTRYDIIRRYLEIYRRCMTEDPKSFDARGAAHALEQISKLLGLTVSAKDTDGNEIVLTLSEEADVLGQ